MKKNIIIIILAILVLGLGGYLVYDKIIDKDVKEKVEEEKTDAKEEKEESKGEELSLDNELVIELLEKFDMLNEPTCAFGWARIQRLYENDKFLMSNYNYSIKLATALDYKGFDEKYHYRSKLTETEVNELKNNYFELFGFDEKFKLESSGETCPVVELNNGQVFIDNSICGCGGAGYALSSKRVTVNAIKYDRSIKIYQKIGFYLHEGIDDYESIVFTSDIEGNNKLVDLKNVDVNTYDFEGYIRNNANQFNTYIITYKKDINDNYYLYSIEKDVLE